MDQKTNARKHRSARRGDARTRLVAAVVAAVCGLGITGGLALAKPWDRWNGGQHFRASSPEQLHKVIAQHYLDLRRYGKTHRANLASPAPDITQPPDDPWPGGIMDEVDQVSRDYQFLNMWVGSNDATNVAVYAGNVAGEENQGAVYVMEEDRATYEMTNQGYPTPEANGAVTITSADGDVLTLTATDGTSFTFDVDTRTFQ